MATFPAHKAQGAASLKAKQYAAAAAAYGALATAAPGPLPKC